MARSPEVQRGAKLTADVGMGVVKAAAPIVGKVGKFAAKTAFSAAVSGVFKKKDKGRGGSKKRDNK